MFKARAIVAICLVGLFVGWANQASAVKHLDTQTETLKETLSALNLDNPDQDVKAHVAGGDFRPVGINGYTCSVPGPDGNNPPPKVGIRCLNGTSDAPESAEHQHLIDVATTYALAYNQALKREIAPK